MATDRNLVDIMRKNLRVLHISCHGIYDKEGNLSKQKSHLGNLFQSQHFLVFESETGEARLIDAEFMENNLICKDKIDLIVLQACQSE